MSTCPFCNKEISEELTLYGGYCPHCLIEVPGEEAATDPGVPLEDEKPTSSSGGRVWVVSALVVVCVAVGWWWTQDGTTSSGGGFRGARPAVPLSAHQDQQYEEEKQKEAAVATKRSRRSRGASNSAKTVPAVETSASASGKAVSSESVAAGLGSAPADMFSAIGAAPRMRGGPQGIVLKDAVKIEEMVARVLTRGSRDVDRCFDAAKRTNPSATGKWYVGFTVSKEGRPVEIGVERLGAANAGVETCIRKAVSAMRFQRVAEQVHVSDTYRMGG